MKISLTPVVVLIFAGMLSGVANGLEMGLRSFQTNKFHYGDPKSGCENDEVAVRLQGIGGDMCAPACDGGSCPTDLPDGVNAQPMCALQQAGTNKKFCALVCQGNNDSCGPNASCKKLGFVGVCTYDD